VVNYGYNDVIGKEYAAGHTVGVHSATHDYHTIYASEDAYFEDLQAMNDIIYAQTGSYADLIRFPGGSSNTISSFNPGIMTRLTKAVEERGYTYFDWNVSSEDAGGTTDPDVVYQNVIDGIQRHEKSVVLMHDSKGYTVEAVERIVLWCLDNGYELRPLTKDSPTAHHGVSN
jgi:peptidoglycan/xylan/chitin deacetylase (PgdA/CDA1 family)